MSDTKITVCKQCGGLQGRTNMINIIASMPKDGSSVILCPGHPVLAMHSGKEGIRRALCYLARYYKDHAVEALDVVRRCLDVQSMQENVNVAMRWEMKCDAVFQVALDLGIDLEETRGGSVNEQNEVNRV